jgi:CRP-like cAMP-binding protein
VLCAQGERPRQALFLGAGFVSRAAVTPRGAELSLSRRGPGALLCTEALRGMAAAQEVRALTRVRLCALSSEGMSAWLGPARSAARALLELVLVEGQNQHDDALLRRGDCLTRVARFALAYASFLAGPSTPVRKGVVARLLGMRPETLSRCLGRLEGEGLLDASRGLRVLDARRLAALAQREEAGG